MKCPHCLVEIHAVHKYVGLGKDTDGYWAIEKYLCPNPVCERLVLYLVYGDPLFTAGKILTGFTKVHDRRLIHPKGTNRSPSPPQVPKRFADDYTEACIVLHDSPKASAALSRRCLQNILREVAEVEPSDLYSEIEKVLESKSLPSHVAEVLHMVREVGNFAAHPIKSKKTGEIISVEPYEAEWNLDVLEALFDFYFVQPELFEKKKQVLDKKLKEAGKRESVTP